MAAALRERARELIGESYRDDEDTADILNKVLDGPKRRPCCATACYIACG
jgi:hypothetical protein